MPDDLELLKRYATCHSESAFAELVARHVDLTYSTALRLMNGDAHRAQDVTQQAFAELARQSKRLTHHPALAGWLYTTTRLVAFRTLRTEQRRKTREQEASAMDELLCQPAAQPDWENLGPVLEDAMHELGEKDRLAVLLRYFQKKNLRDVGAALGLNENAARMRVNRAVEKLRAQLAEKGITSTTSALAVALTGNAVTAAPAGLAASVSIAALTSAAGTATTFTLLKFMAMTKIQFGVAALLLTGAAISLLTQQRRQVAWREETQSLRQQIAQLQIENANLSNHVGDAKSALKLNLPAPRIQVRTPSYSDIDATNLIARLNRGEKAPTLTPVQAEKFVNENHRTAASLLAAFRATGDQKLLKEATEKYPLDPQVAFTAAYAPDASAEDRRHWLDVFKQSAPGNALADYLSAADHFQAGRMDQAIQDLSAAFSKHIYQDYSLDFIESGSDAYRAAGYSEAEARIIPSMSILLPQFAELKQVNDQLVNLAAAYRQAGDEPSAKAALEMDLALGQRLTAPANASLLSQQVGLAIESNALRQMDPNSPFANSGQTVQEQLNQITQQRNTLREFDKQLNQIYATISAPDWISYHDRWLAFGEENAMKWLLDKYEQK